MGSGGFGPSGALVPNCSYSRFPDSCGWWEVVVVPNAFGPSPVQALAPNAQLAPACSARRLSRPRAARLFMAHGRHPTAVYARARRAFDL